MTLVICTLGLGMECPWLARKAEGPGFRDHEAGASIWLSRALFVEARSKVRTEGCRMVLRLEACSTGWKDCLPFEGHMHQDVFLTLCCAHLHNGVGLTGLWMSSLLVRRGPGGPQSPPAPAIRIQGVPLPPLVPVSQIFIHPLFLVSQFLGFTDPEHITHPPPLLSCPTLEWEIVIVPTS